MSFYGQVVDAEKLRQERDQWKDEALRWREKNEALAIIVASLESERNALRKRLESAVEFSSPVFLRMLEKQAEEEGVSQADVLKVAFGIYMFYRRGKSESAGWYTEEAEAAALKALEVAE